jgi:hypothetical protein
MSENSMRELVTDDSSELFLAADSGLTVAQARLLERIQNDPMPPDLRQRSGEAANFRDCGSQVRATPPKLFPL